MKFNSICVKELREKQGVRSHILPIYSTSSFSFDNVEQCINVFEGKEKGYAYGRYGNPTVEAVANKIAELETYGLDIQAQAIMTGSGMSAISTLLIAALKSGDKVLTQGNIYGGTTELLTKTLAQFGVETVFVNLQDLDKVEEIVKADPSIKMLYFESPANPTLACVDLAKMSQIAKKYNCLTTIDNTFCTPYLQQPFKYGIDFVVHSTTKFLNGHGNAISGVVVGRDADFMKEKVWETMKLIGTNCSPFDAWLTWTGIKTLNIRMDRHCQNAMKVAQVLDAHPLVKHVNYNGLVSHASHKIAKWQMRQFGAMLSFELKGGLEAGIEFMNRIRFCTLAPTLGDVDTIIAMSHANVPTELRERNGISEGLIRISVGIEDDRDIIADIEQALKISCAKKPQKKSLATVS